MSLRVDPFGPDALLVRFATQGDGEAFERSRALLRRLEEQPPTGLVEITPGMTTVLLEFEPGSRPDPAFLSAILADAARVKPGQNPPSRTLEVPVVYDGDDLEALATRTGLPRQRVVELHAAPLYRVQILGFSPGFPYLAGLDRRLHVPRLGTPRPRVPAGSVGIGGEHTGIYPVATAGGWNLIGRTDLPLVDATAARASDPDAFALHPGDAVRFVPVKSLNLHETSGAAREDTPCE